MFDIDALLKSQSHVSMMPLLRGPGVYAISVAVPDALPMLEARDHSVIYVGMTEDGLDVRNHFHYEHSGKSSLRRSLGALLRYDLGLAAIPRAPGSSRTNVVNYRFGDEGERALSTWMAHNLLMAQQRLSHDVLGRERELIAALEPPLNLTGWANPYRRRLKTLRAECVREAENARLPSSAPDV